MRAIRCANADSNGNSNVNCNSDCNGYAYIYSKAYSHTEACTITEASPDSGSTPVVRQRELGQCSSNQSMKPLSSLKWL